MRRSRVTYGHKSYIFNEHWTATTPPAQDSTKLTNTVTIDRVLKRPQYRDVRDALHLAQGGTAGRVHKGLLTLSMAGRILVPAGSQAETLEDREVALRLALDPYECYRDSPTTDGVYALDWQAPTTDTVNYPSGWIGYRYYARPMSQPETVASVADGASLPWSCGFICPDPRLYEQTVQSSAGASGTRSLTNKGNVPAPLRVTITMSGAGSSIFTITRSGVSFLLDLSACVAADVVVVVMETCGPFGRGRYITKNGVEAFLKTSAATTWLDVPVGATSFTVANDAGISDLKYEFYHARA
ncbi:MAG: hypothetical protein FIA92_02770 [Chloroflexi bacterium]|nr:hypothetical protein [Chloroflexota bacterium]